MRESMYKVRGQQSESFLFEELSILSTQGLSIICKYVTKFSFCASTLFFLTKTVTDVVLKSPQRSKEAIYFSTSAM